MPASKAATQPSGAVVAPARTPRVPAPRAAPRLFVAVAAALAAAAVYVVVVPAGGVRRETARMSSLLQRQLQAGVEESRQLQAGVAPTYTPTAAVPLPQPSVLPTYEPTAASAAPSNYICSACWARSVDALDCSL